jgi:hypothetical protein
MISRPTSASAALLATVVSVHAGGKERRRKVAPRLEAAPAASDARVVGPLRVQRVSTLCITLYSHGFVEEYAFDQGCAIRVQYYA